MPKRPEVSAPRKAPGLSPLYRQVRTLLIQRIAEGHWRPGVLIPSEMQIAAELGVSQGTVRKALDEMTVENLLVRQQGRGTFVAQHDEARILFQFFKIAPDTGEPVFPESILRACVEAAADAGEAAALNLRAGAPVIRIARLRSLAGQAVISEYITVSAQLFPELGHDGALPNNLYAHYANRFGVTVAGGRERVKALPATAEDAPLLGLEAGAPVLLIDRVATALDGAPVEWRRSYCVTESCSYVSLLR
ncbi:MAG: GntR family transcriptional regulator [Proteobacteria bacterium]|nr:GntR family transcriptional regulator [Pseudomonadota bacterium]